MQWDGNPSLPLARYGQTSELGVWTNASFCDMIGVKGRPIIPSILLADDNTTPRYGPSSAWTNRDRSPGMGQRVWGDARPGHGDTSGLAFR